MSLTMDFASEMRGQEVGGGKYANQRVLLVGSAAEQTRQHMPRLLPAGANRLFSINRSLDLTSAYRNQEHHCGHAEVHSPTNEP